MVDVIVKAVVEMMRIDHGRHGQSATAHVPEYTDIHEAWHVEDKAKQEDENSKYPPFPPVQKLMRSEGYAHVHIPVHSDKDHHEYSNGLGCFQQGKHVQLHGLESQTVLNHILQGVSQQGN